MTIDTTKPFTRAEALAAGITDPELLSRAYQRLFHGLYVRADIRVGVRELARAALHISPLGSYASHETAAILWGGWVEGATEIHVSVRGALSRSERRGIVAHRGDIEVEPVLHRGLPLSSPTQVFLELAAARKNLVELVVLGDSLVKATRTTPEELIAAANAYEGKGCRLARRAAAFVREGADSPTESRLRLLIVLAGLVEPRTNFIVRDADGNWVRRFDLCYPALKLIIEYDGRHHAEVRERWVKDLQRREELERQGWRIIVITAEGLFGDPLRTLERIREALRDRGHQDLVRRVPAEWYRLFTSRTKAAA